MNNRESCQKENLWRSFEEKKLEGVIEDLDKIALERLRRGEIQSCIWEICAAMGSLHIVRGKLYSVLERENERAYKGEGEEK